MDTLERTLMTISCADCAKIPKVIDAGRCLDTADGPVQIMHNGLKVVAGGYHGDWMAHIIRALRGHHEPQEELLFDTVVNYSRHNSIFVELGAFWSYYSLWFLNSVPGSRAICIEPDAANLNVGVRNAALNKLDTRIEFHNAGVGGVAKEQHGVWCESMNAEAILPCYDMNAVLALSADQTIEVLHIDVQGAELPFLQSMPSAVAKGAIRFLVVSTHHSSISGSKTTHGDCLAMIETMGGAILAEHDVQESFSGDGLIVASFLAADRNITMPPMSRNVARNSLFPEL